MMREDETRLRQLRPGTSARPELIVDTRARKLTDSDAVANRVGMPGPWSRHRCLFALPMGPQWLKSPTVVHDHDGCYIADPDGNLLGRAGVLVHRSLPAGKVEDTRRL